MDIATLGIRVDSTQVSDAKGQLEALGTSGDLVASRLKGAFAAAAAAFGVHEIIHKFVEETILAQNAVAQLEAGVRSTGGAAGVTTDELLRMARALQQVTTYSDEAVESAQSILLTFDKIKGDNFNRTTAAVTDLAARMGGDLAGAAFSLGKALNDPAESLTLLRRQGIQFSAAQKEVIKSLVETNHMAEAQAIILDVVERKFQGSAAAARDTYGGALQGLRHDISDVFELTKAETSGLVSLIETLGAAARWVVENREAFKSFALAIGAATVALLAFYAVLQLGPLVAWTRGVLAAIQALIFWTNAIGSLSGAMALGAAGVGSFAASIALAIAPVALLTVAFLALWAAIHQFREEARIADEEIKGAEHDSDVLAALNFRRAHGQSAAQAAYPGIFPAARPGSPVAVQQGETRDATEDELKRATAAKKLIETLRQEADVLGLTEEATRRYQLAHTRLDESGRQLTNTELALAQAQLARIEAFNRATQDEARALTDAQTAYETQGQAEADAIKQSEELKRADAQATNDAAAALYDQVAAMQVETDEYTRQAAVIKASKSVRNTLLVQLAGERAYREAIADAIARGISYSEEELRLIRAAAEARERARQAASGDTKDAEALANAKELTAQIGQSVDVMLQLAQVTDEAGQHFLKLAASVVQVVSNVSLLVTAMKAGSQGDFISASLGIFAGLGGLLGGKPNPQELENQRIHQANTDAIIKLTQEIGNFGLDLTGNEFTSAQRLAKSLSGASDREIQRQITSTNDPDFQLLKKVADALHIELNTSSLDAFRDSLHQLDLAIQQTELTKFAETFAGQMQALSAQWRIFNTTDPLQKLKDMLAISAGTHTERRGFLSMQVANDTASPALVEAIKGLDLNTKAGRDQLQHNIEDLFMQLKAGTLTPEQLGGLTAQEFLDQLTGLSDLLRETSASFQNVIDGLREFTKSLKLDPTLSTLSPIAQLAEARRQYEDLFAKAQAGDTTAAAQLPEAARAFLEASRTVNASGPQYAADFARIMAQVESIASLFEGKQDVQQKGLAATESTAANTGETVKQLQTTVAVLIDGFTKQNDKFDRLMDQQTTQNRKLVNALQGLDR